jgi:hypothetical protein
VRTGVTADTPGPKRYAGGRLASEPQSVLSPVQPAWSRQLKALSSVQRECGRSYSAVFVPGVQPGAKALYLEANQAHRRENASERVGCRRRHSSLMISCNGIYMVKAAREQHCRNGEDGERITRRYFQPGVNRPHRELQICQGPCNAAPLVRPWDTKTSRLVCPSVVAPLFLESRMR